MVGGHRVHLILLGRKEGSKILRKEQLWFGQHQGIPFNPDCLEGGTVKSKGWILLQAHHPSFPAIKGTVFFEPGLEPAHVCLLSLCSLQR